MNSGELARYAALGIGSFQLLANSVLLLRGFTRLPVEITREGATARIGDLLRTAWVYGMLGNLCTSVILLFIASGLRAGEPLARQVASVIGGYYLVLGIAAYVFAETRHTGLLVFSAFGLLLLGALWLPNG